MNKTDDGYSVDFLDTDDDGLTDWEEFDKDSGLIDLRMSPVIPKLPTLRQVKDNQIEINMTARYEREIKGLGDFLNYVTVAPFNSDPTLADSDGDGYDDYYETKIYNSNPLVSDVIKHEIADENFIRIDTDNVKKFDWSYYYDGITTVSYGGRQQWFEYIIKKDDIKDSESYAKYKKLMGISQSGCGLISGSDIALYLCRKFDKSNHIIGDWYLDDIIDIDDYSDYIWYMQTTQLEIPPVTLDGLNSGIDGYSLAGGLNNYFYFNDINLKAKWGVSESKILEKTIEMIDKDIPVSLSIGPSLSASNAGVKLYIENTSSPVPSFISPSWRVIQETGEIIKCQGHYVTVTGVLIDKIAGKTYLQVSSWGAKYFIDFEEYKEYKENYFIADLSSNILYIS